jgi:hypothetical protein
MNEDKIDQNRHLGPWAPLGPSVVPATTSQDAPQSESGAIEQLQQHHQHPDFEETPLQTERRRAKTSLQLLLDFTDVLGSRINRSIDLSPSSSVIFHRVVSVHWITKVQPWHRNRVR